MFDLIPRFPQNRESYHLVTGPYPHSGNCSARQQIDRILHAHAEPARRKELETFRSTKEKKKGTSRDPLTITIGNHVKKVIPKEIIKNSNQPRTVRFWDAVRPSAGRGQHRGADGTGRSSRGDPGSRESEEYPSTTRVETNSRAFGERRRTLRCDSEVESTPSQRHVLTAAPGHPTPD